MLYERDTNRVVIDDPSQIRILKLNSGGEPLEWIDYEDSAYFKATDKILWTIRGDHEVILRGGTNIKTGIRSEMRIDTIIAVDSNLSPTKYRNPIPALNNPQLFARDRHLCGYCGEVFPKSKLTRDHIHPRSRGGPDTWENVITACKACNQKKDDRLPSEANMELLYVPYAPSYNEKLILENGRILADQMEFLLKGVSKNSRLHDEFTAQ